MAAAVVEAVAATKRQLGVLGPSVKFTASTTDAPLNFNVDLGPYCVLDLQASTSNAPVDVKIMNYQGDFHVSSSGSTPPVIKRNGTPDPTGQKRLRNVTMNELRGGDGETYTVEGQARWGQSDGQAIGSVDVSTTNGPLILTV